MSDPAEPTRDTRFFGHPRGLAILFFTEMWERFSYYGMRALLILYLTAAVSEGGLGFNAGAAGSVYALYTSMVYLFGIPGGWIADRLIGQRRAVLVGGVLIAAGHFSMALPSTVAFFVGLGLVIIGTGLLKPNISVIVGQLYARNDERRDAGFSLFYMGINIGALLGPLVCSLLGEKVDWHLGFGVSGVGMVLGVILYLRGASALGDAGMKPSRPDTPEAAAAIKRQVWNALGAVVALSAVAVGLVSAGVIQLTADSLSNAFGIVLLTLTVALFGWLFLRGDWTAVERKRLWAIVALFLASALFWSAYEQAGSSLTLFAKRDTDREVGSLGTFPAGWFQQVPAFFVILLAPAFAWLWIRMGSRQPSSPTKFVVGLVFVGLGFVVMVGASIASANGIRVSPMWLIATYFLHVVGEMCVSPVGISTVSKLAPQRASSLMMGVWFLATAVGNYLGGRTAGLYDTLELPTLFGFVAATAIVAGVVLAFLVPRIRSLMGGVN